MRLALVEEADSVAAVLSRAFGPLRARYTPEAFAYTVGTSETARSRIDEGPVWLALEASRPIGTVSAYCCGDRLYVRGMAVIPETQGLGVAKELLGRVLAYGIEQRSRSLFLHTTPFLESAIHLYERIGFRMTDEGPHDLFGTPLLAMELAL